ncbi:MAG: hypothetical protein JWP97_2360, partial [Labilithrix sp.]|nr:hypothetical protein [Labilithrix sp.]
MKPWLRPLPFALVAGFFVSRAGRTSVDDAAPSRSAALCSALAASGVACVAEDVTWVDGPSGTLGAAFGSARALVRGHGRSGGDPDDTSGAPSERNETFDLFLARARLSPEGHLLELLDVHDLTRTSGADEGRPVLSGSRAAYVVTVDGRPEAVHVLDLAGSEAKAYEELSRFQRFQVSVADWQRTGQRRGVRRTVYTLVPPPARAELAFRPDGSLAVTTEARTLLLDAAGDVVIDGAAFARVTPDAVTKPPTFGPWMSD